MIHEQVSLRANVREDTCFLSIIRLSIDMAKTAKKNYNNFFEKYLIC